MSWLDSKTDDELFPDMKAARRAGQASTEQIMKWQDDLIQELQAKCAELQKDADSRIHPTVHQLVEDQLARVTAELKEHEMIKETPMAEQAEKDRIAFEQGYLAGQASAQAEINEQCRLNGMGSEREARLMARVEELEQALKVADEGRNYANELLSLKAQAGASVTENTSDGYHTFKELYECRHALFVALLRSNPSISWRANNNYDGTHYEGWFVAGMHLPSGDISFHIPVSYWEMLDGCLIATTNCAPPFDGHNTADVIKRLLTPIRPTTERRVIPEDFRKVMEMALDALDLYFGDFHPDNLDKFDAAGYEAIAALRNALNAAPKESK